MHSSIPIVFFFCLFYVCQCQSEYWEKRYDDLQKQIASSLTRSILATYRSRKNKAANKRVVDQSSDEESEEVESVVNAKRNKQKWAIGFRTMKQTEDVYQDMVNNKIPICSDDNLQEYKNMVPESASSRRRKLLKTLKRGNQDEQKPLRKLVPLCLIEKDVMNYILEHRPAPNPLDGGRKRRRKW
ncbi:unnamed protein product [Nezara viridula]|uniref:Neuropeptide n=1 Tax=Nezara viridula TaxID=85310 RepID=A0A9P0H8U0_NEZVI|nr:unnamed protein product [Nezara viridula]